MSLNAPCSNLRDEAAMDPQEYAERVFLEKSRATVDGIPALSASEHAVVVAKRAALSDLLARAIARNTNTAA